MLPAIGIVISVLSLALSATTLWLSVLRRGRLAMTMPSIVFFGFDEVPRPTPKVFLRTLLYSTATQGQVIEALYLTLRQEKGGQRTFSFWGYDEGSRLVPGSGLFVSHSGVVANHHLVQSVHEMPYDFLSGEYQIKVFARVVGRRKPRQLADFKIDLSSANAYALKKRKGILFERAPDTLEYRGHIQSAPARSGIPIANGLR